VLQHQLIVVDCLESTDETLKKETLELLFRMTNNVNVKFIVDKMIQNLKLSLDSSFKKNLIQKITTLTERYAPDSFWLI